MTSRIFLTVTSILFVISLIAAAVLGTLYVQTKGVLYQEQTQLEQSQATLLTTQEQLKLSQADLITVQGQIKQSQADLSTIQGQLKQSQADLSTTQKQLTDAKTKISDLESANSKLIGDLGTSKSDSAKANLQLSKYLCENTSLNMDYSNNSIVAIRLQNFVSTLPGVRSVSYVIPEKLYVNTISQLYYVSYVSSDDGKVYSKRYIVYMKEFGWSPSTFSIDGQCWIDSPF
jgi:septal ring factor EnvC (AmiA/AmiB activator)